MSYRQDGDAELARREALEHAVASESDLDRREALAAELAALDRTRRSEAKRRLPMVAQARIASPCHEPFEAMIGSGAIRACARCDQEVFDLAQMTLAQAEALIASRSGGGKLCARLLKRSDGTIMFADCEVGARGVRSRRGALVVAAAAIAGIATAVIAGPPMHLDHFWTHSVRRAPHTAQPHLAPYEHVQGEMQFIPAPPRPTWVDTPPASLPAFSSLDLAGRRIVGS